MYSRCLLLSLPAAPLTFPPHNKRAPLNALYGVKVGVLESCHLIGSEDFAIPQSHLLFRSPSLFRFVTLVSEVASKISGTFEFCESGSYNKIMFKIKRVDSQFPVGLK